MLRAAAAKFKLQQPGRDAETESTEGLQHHTPPSQGGWQPACVCIELMIRDMMFSKRIVCELDRLLKAGKLD